MINDNTIYWLWLAEKCGVASKFFDKLAEKYPNPFDLYRLEDSEIEQLPLIPAKLKERLCEKNLDRSYDIIKFCKQNKVDIIAYGDKQYPERLRLIEDPPIVLYCLGHFPSFDSVLSTAIVGTRKMSEYGKRSAYKIAYELSSAGVLTVSGMALGIDAMAASGTLAAGGRTVAVLGCGIKTCYPKTHKKLMAEIIKHGAVITEFAPDEEPRGHHFPLRNRIISGLCQGTLVVEGARKSGALITAELAIGQGREVFAVPGKISDEGAEGPNELIQKGAYTALSSLDILKFYEFLYGDVLDIKAAQNATKRMPELEGVLKRYDLDYALSKGGSTEEKIFYPVHGKKKNEKTEREIEQPVRTEERREAVERDSSAEFLAGLDENTKKVFASMPLSRAVDIDTLKGCGVPVSDIITALTMLEVGGLVSSLPGGVFIRK